MQMMRIPGVGYLVVLLAGVWLIQQIVTALAGPLTIILVVCSIGVVLGLLHTLDLTEPLRKIPGIGGTVMDLLDRYTRKAQLVAIVGGDASPGGPRVVKAEILDEEKLRRDLKSVVIGQDLVIDEVTTLLRRRLARTERTGPVAVMLFAGPPGTGKTETAKQIGKAMGRPFYFFDMSACSDKEGASTLFGSPKGYQGSDSYGRLTAALRDQPRAIVLLDEVEKAAPEVLTKFLVAWNDGFVQEASDGAKIATNNAIFVMTTNAAQDRIAELVRTISDRDQLTKAVNDTLKEARFRPEVLSRIDRVFSFKNLEGLDQARLAIVQIKRLAQEYGLALVEDETAIDPALLGEVMERAGMLQSAGGVREVIRALESRLADEMIACRDRGADRCRIKMDEDQFLKVEAA